jgi:hypothetical protein
VCWRLSLMSNAYLAAQFVCWRLSLMSKAYLATQFVCWRLSLMSNAYLATKLARGLGQVSLHCVAALRLQRVPGERLLPVEEPRLHTTAPPHGARRLLRCLHACRRRLRLQEPNPLPVSSVSY